MSADKYFNETIKIQTIMKHYILKSCLETSLSIANKNKMHDKNDRKYIFIDCYAGAGTINGEHQGSPLLACEVFNKALPQLDKIKEFKLIFFETNKEHYNLLSKNLSKIPDIMLPFEIRNNTWTNNIDTYLKNFKEDYGFIFIDPYANEDIDLELLEKIIKNHYFQEILIFLNIQALRRLVGKNIDNTLKISKENIQNNNIENEIYKKFSNLGKQFVLFASFPTERQQKMINSDYFGLIYMTNSANVADKFLEAYKQIIENFKDTQNVLFGTRDIKEEIIETLKSHKKINLLTLVKILQERYLSWKKTLKIEEIPTLKNILNSLNDLSKEKRIQINSPFLNKKTKITLTQLAIKTNNNLKQTIIQIR